MYIEELQFDKTHRRQLGMPNSLDVDAQETNIGQLFPQESFPNDKISDLSVGKLTTGTIKSQQITLGVTAGGGDVYIAGGTFDVAAWTTTGGFILGLDDSDSDAPKFFIGDGTTSLDWNVTTANTLTIIGSITATTGSIGGWTIDATSLTSNAGQVGMSSAATGALDVRFWAGNVMASAPFRVYENGNFTATQATITGAITATSGTIGSFTIGTYLYTGTKTAFDDTNAGVHLGSDGIGIGNNVFTVSSAGALVATSATITGAITATSGSFTGTINATAGKFGTATNYWSVGATGLTATSASTDVIINYGKTDFTNTDTGFILGYDWSASLPKFYIGTATKYFNFDGQDVVVGSGIFNAGAMINALTLGDGTSNSGRITLSIADGQGDCYIAAGKTDFTNTDSGFILGIDDSDSNLSKFYCGNSTNYISWDGIKLVIAGDLINIDTSTDIIIGTIVPVYAGTAGEYLFADDAVYMNADGKIYKTDAAVAGTCTSYIGLVLANADTDTAVRIQLNGYYSGIAGLTVGSAYYLKDGLSVAQTSGSSPASILSDDWSSETFTATNTKFQKAILRLYRAVSSSANNVVVELQTCTTDVVATAKPTGTVLATATIVQNTLTTSTGGADYTFSLPYNGLEVNKMYCIVLKYPTGNGEVRWLIQGGGSTYAGGNYVNTTDGGTNWIIDSAADARFSLYMDSGAVSTTPGSTSKKVGIFLEATKLLMVNS